MPSKVKILYLHVVADAVSTDPGGEVGVAGGGDEVVALARVELQLVGERREGSETDGEDSKILRHAVIFRYSNIRHSCYANMPITTFSLILSSHWLKLRILSCYWSILFYLSTRGSLQYATTLG